MEENQVNLGNSASRRSFLFNRISFGILLLVTFLVPVFFLPLSFISTQFGTSLLFAFGVILVTLIYIVSGFIQGSLLLPVRTKYILGFMALVPFVYALSGIANGFSRLPFFGYTFDISTVGFVVLSFMYLFLVSVLFKNKESILKSYIAFAISAGILGLFIVLRLILGAGFLSFGIFTDITITALGTWNNVGIFFGILLLLSLLAHQMLSISKMAKVFLTIIMIICLFFVALVNFNALWAVIGIVAFLFILYGVFNQKPVTMIGTIGIAAPRPTLKRKLSRIGLYPLLLLIISAIFLIWSASIGTYLPNAFHITNVDVRPSLSTTLEIARSTIQTRPLFGSGPDTFATQWLTWRPDDVTTTVFWDTTFTAGIGLIPTYAVTTGIIGLLSWLVFLGFFISLGVKSIFQKYEDVFLKYLVVSSFFISLYLWMMMFVYVPGIVVFILTFFFSGLFFASIYLSGTVSVAPIVFSDSPRKGFVSTLIMVLVFVIVIVLAYGLFKNSEALWYFQKSSYALNTSNDVAASETYMQDAINAVPHDINYRAMSEIELQKITNILAQDPTKVPAATIQQQFSTALDQAIKAGISATEADPTDYLNWVALGNVYAAVASPQLAVQGAYQGALNAYNEALQRDPKDPSMYLLFARLAVTDGDLTSATSYAEQAIQLKNNYFDAYFLLSQIEVANKDVPDAITAATAASVIDPTDSGTFFQLGLLKYDSGDYQGAITALNQAITLTPDYANAQYFLGLAYSMTGQQDKALALFTELNTTNPNNSQIIVILTNLEAGRPALSDAPVAAPQKATSLPVKQ